MPNHARHANLSVYRSAITEQDGLAVNVWYLVIFWTAVAVLPAVVVMVAGACWQAWIDEKHIFPYAALGAGIGAAVGAFAAGITAIAAAMRGQAGQQP